MRNNYHVNAMKKQREIARPAPNGNAARRDGAIKGILPAAQLFAAECDEDVAAFLGRERNSLA